jgi:hypothetical protein
MLWNYLIAWWIDSFPAFITSMLVNSYTVWYSASVAHDIFTVGLRVLTLLTACARSSSLHSIKRMSWPYEGSCVF